MDKQQLLEAMREIFNGLYDVRVEGLSREADTAFQQAMIESVVQVARRERQRHAQPPFVILRAQTPDGETVELRITLDYYQKERVSS